MIKLSWEESMKQKGSIANIYKRQQVESASPLELILLLYNAALDSLTLAEEVYDDKDPSTIEKFHKHLIKTQNIVTELIIALDMENGGELVMNLFKVYEYINWRLGKINISKEIEGIEEVKNLLNILKGGWLSVQEKEKKEQPSSKSEEGGLNIQG